VADRAPSLPSTSWPLVGGIDGERCIDGDGGGVGGDGEGK